MYQNVILSFKLYENDYQSKITSSNLTDILCERTKEHSDVKINAHEFNLV